MTQKKLVQLLEKQLKSKTTNVWAVVIIVGLLLLSSYWPENQNTTQNRSSTTTATPRAKGDYELTGKISHVADGDTINIQVDGQRERIRLSSIDAPESEGRSDRPGQPYAEQSQKALANMLLNKTMTLTCYEQDRYGRHVCDVLLDNGKTVSQVMVESGWAWAYTGSNNRYLRDKTLPVIQEQAQKARRGLWQEKNPIAPWVWRVQCWQKKQCK